MIQPSQVRAERVRELLTRAGAEWSLRVKVDGLTREWIVDGKRMGTGAAERYALTALEEGA